MKTQIHSPAREVSFDGKLGRSRKSSQLDIKGRPVHRRIAAIFVSGSQGSAMVELALVLPILLTLCTGICAFGVAFSNQLTLNRAVGTSGQYLQLIRTSTTDPCQDTFNAISAAAPNFNASNITLTLSLNGTSFTANSCPGDQSYLVQGQPVTVTATYPCTLAIYGTKFSDSCLLSAKVTEYEY